MGAPSYRFGLFRRLARLPPPPDLVGDVVEHLNQLLNTKEDYGSFLPGFGLSISDTMWGKESLLELAEHVRGVIARFEPRIGGLAIEPVARDSELCPLFRLTGVVGGAPVRLAISLHTLYCDVRVKET